VLRHFIGNAWTTVQRYNDTTYTLHVLPSPLFEKEYTEVTFTTPRRVYLFCKHLQVFSVLTTSDLIYLIPTPAEKKRVKRKQKIETKWPLQLRRSSSSPVGPNFPGFFPLSVFRFPFLERQLHHQSRYISLRVWRANSEIRNRIYARAIQTKTIINRAIVDAQ
jgi:hypothetical protein